MCVISIDAVVPSSKQASNIKRSVLRGEPRHGRFCCSSLCSSVYSVSTRKKQANMVLCRCVWLWATTRLHSCWITVRATLIRRVTMVTWSLTSGIPCVGLVCRLCVQCGHPGRSVLASWPSGLKVARWPPGRLSVHRFEPLQTCLAGESHVLYLHQVLKP